jgi:hypothetical protein
MRILLVGLGAVILASCNGGSGPASSPPSIGSVVGQAGFQELALPSTAYGPGSLVTSVKGFGLQSPLRLAYICDPTFTASFPPQIDTAASQQLAHSLGAGLKFSGGGLAALGLSAQAEHLDSVTVEFSNVRVEQLSFESLGRIVNGLGPECTDLLTDFRGQGIARQTQQALRADVVYRANFKAGASAEVKNAVIGILTAGFGGSVENVSGSTVEGRGLYYGVILREV